MDLKKELTEIEVLNKIYHQDIDGLKSLSAEKYGCSVAWFRLIVNNDSKANKGVENAIKAVKDAAQEIVNKHTKINELIQSI